MATTTKILIADDEISLRSLVGSYLRAEGYEVVEAVDGETAVDAVKKGRLDLVILDVRMPGLDGIEALRQIRTFSDVYVIMLTARAEEADKLVGLAVGADDYLTKPFSPRELVARVKAVLRRGRSGATSNRDEVLTFPSLAINKGTRTIVHGDLRPQLTTLEFDLISALASQPGRVFSRRQLLEAVWGWDYFGDERVVDVHIRNLRKALSDDASQPSIIETVRGVGYRFLPGRE